MGSGGGGGGRFISPEGALPFDVMLKGDGIGIHRGSEISMDSDCSMSMKWYVGVLSIRQTPLVTYIHCLLNDFRFYAILRRT